MSAKTILLWVVVLIIIAGGGWYIYQSTMQQPAAQQQQQTQQQASASTSTPQVQAQDVTVGTGAQATPGSQVAVLYVGYLGRISTSTVFDSSAAHGNKPFGFTLGDQNGPIAGFQIGVNGMKVGGERLMAIPATLGYGSNAVHQNPQDLNSPVVIPPNSTIIFDVKLVSVGSASSTAATTATKPIKK